MLIFYHFTPMISTILRYQHHSVYYLSHEYCVRMCITGLPEAETSLDIQFKSVNLHDQNTVQRFVESLIEDLLLASPNPMRENTLEHQVPVDKYAVFSRFFWRTVSTTRSCENLLAL